MRIIITLIPNLKKNLERRNRQSKTAKTPLPKSAPNTSLKDTQICDVISWARLYRALRGLLA